MRSSGAEEKMLREEKLDRLLGSAEAPRGDLFVCLFIHSSFRNLYLARARLGLKAEETIIN